MKPNCTSPFNLCRLHLAQLNVHVIQLLTLKFDFRALARFQKDEMDNADCGPTDTNLNHLNSLTFNNSVFNPFVEFL